jgi:uncharacterized protein DUF1905
MSTHDFTARLWLHNGMPGAWYFITLPFDAADEIRATQEQRGFGSVRVHATIGDSTWNTSVFPDTKTGCSSYPSRLPCAAGRTSTRETSSRSGSRPAR